MKKLNIQKSLTRSKAFLWAIIHGKLRFAVVIVRLALETVLPRADQQTAALGTGDGTAL